MMAVMLRRLFTVASALSLLVCAALVVLLVRSLVLPVLRSGRYSDGTYELTSFGGRVQWQWAPHDPERWAVPVPGGAPAGDLGSVSVGNAIYTFRPAPGVIWSEERVTRWAWGRPPITWVQRRSGTVSYWPPILLFLVLPTVWFARWAWRRHPRLVLSFLGFRREKKPRTGFDVLQGPTAPPADGVRQ